MEIRDEVSEKVPLKREVFVTEEGGYLVSLERRRYWALAQEVRDFLDGWI